MKVVFLSNYFNHHQSEFCDHLNAFLGDGNFLFVETASITAERTKLCWPQIERPYLIKLSEHNKSTILKMINDADIVINGSSPYDLIEQRIKNKKIIFFYSERIFKNKFNNAKYIKYYFAYKKRDRNNVFILCASAYASNDYKKLGFKHTTFYKWGYFPSLKCYDSVDEIIENKNPLKILWVGRYIKWKHPEVAIISLKDLIIKYGLVLKMIGTGPMQKKLDSIARRYGLNNSVVISNSLSPEEVRKEMEDSTILLFTSDFNEGWGAVLNEAMNSACVVVGNHAAGSVPFLINHGKNGFIYKNNDLKSIARIVNYILENKEESKQMAKKAYETICNIWSPEIAAKRLFELFQDILANNAGSFKYTVGPCSKADFLKNGWYKK